MRKLTLILFTLVLTVANTAFGAESDLFAVGIGTSLGVSRTTAMGATTQSHFNTDISLRVKVLNALAVEYSYSPTESTHPANLIFDGAHRLSGLLYIVPTSPVAAYLKFGVGAGNIDDLFEIWGASTSYHGGIGLDVDVTNNLVIGAEFLLLVPGVSSAKNVLEDLAVNEVARLQDPTRRYTEPPTEVPQVSDFFSADNFRFAVGARYYF